VSGSKEVIEAYESWDPDQESATQMAKRLGISKARLYQILDKEDVTPKRRRPPEHEVSYLAGWGEDAQEAEDDSRRNRDVAILRIERLQPLLDEITNRGIRSILDELKELRKEVAEYRERFGPLDS
jgi:hypothetical protein